MIRPFRGILPTLGAGAYVDDSAVVIGDVVIGEDASVWMGAVIRGDVNRIRIGARTNVQDLCAIHADFGELWTEVAEEVTIGHGAILHGCRVGPRCLIGMGAKLLNGVRVGADSVIAAGAVVPEGMEVPPRSLVVGVPGRVRRALTDEEVAQLPLGAEHYVEYKELHRARA
jgi:carbonic anhydrase/acetyltransferase-like protein (isoleucine patch superfamily)